MALFRKALIRFGCVVLIGVSAYWAFTNWSADWWRTITEIVCGSLILLYLIFDLFEDQIRNRFSIFSRFSTKYIRLVVSDKRTEIYGIKGSKVFSVANRFVWRSGEKGGQALAVGDPEDWLTSPSEELLANAVYTDLVTEASLSTPQIDELWQAFILYCNAVGMKKDGISFLRRHMLYPLRVDVQISDPFKRDFIAGLIRKTKLLPPLEVYTSEQDKLDKPIV